MEMKKGKGSQIPIDRRGEFMKRQKMMEEVKKNERERPKDVPIFKIFVRIKTGSPWFPCSELYGDKKATALVNAWTSGFLTDMYKGQLDSGLARSIFNQEDDLVKGITENLKPFKKFTKKDLEFGYKVEFPGVEEKMGEQKVQLLVKGMEKTWFENLKEGFDNFISGGEKDKEVLTEIKS
jgi:hypothetical protein